MLVATVLTINLSQHFERKDLVLVLRPGMRKSRKPYSCKCPCQVCYVIPQFVDNPERISRVLPVPTVFNNSKSLTDKFFDEDPNSLFFGCCAISSGCSTLCLSWYAAMKSFSSCKLFPLSPPFSSPSENDEGAVDCSSFVCEPLLSLRT